MSEQEQTIERQIAKLTPESTKNDRNRVLTLIAGESDPAEREKLLKEASFQTRIRLADLRKAVKLAPRVERTKPKPVEMSDAEREECLALLKDPELLRRVLDDSAAMGIVGEEDNRALLELAYCSRLDADPVNINVKGESSAGKNHLIGTMARMHPPEEVMQITYASAKSLLYLNEPLAHKILMVTEAPGAEEAQYSIRTLESEKKLKVLVAERGPDNRIQTREHTVEGPVAFVQTTTKPHVHAENETRTFDVFIDESDDQTRAILREQARRAERPEESAGRDKIERRWQNAHRLLKSYPIVVPFADAVVEVLAKRRSLLLRVRRDFPRVLALIRASALLHQYQREHAKRNDIEYIVANEDDYTIVREVAGPALAQVWMEATPRCRELVEAASCFGDSNPFCTHDLVKVLHWSAPTVRKYAEEAVHLGCLAPTVTPCRWRYAASIAEVQNPLPVPEVIFAIA